MNATKNLSIQTALIVEVRSQPWKNTRSGRLILKNGSILSMTRRQRRAYNRAMDLDVRDILNAR